MKKGIMLALGLLLLIVVFLGHADGTTDQIGREAIKVTDAREELHSCFEKIPSDEGMKNVQVRTYIFNLNELLYTEVQTEGQTEFEAILALRNELARFLGERER